MAIPHIVYPFICWWKYGVFHVLAIMNCAAMHMYIQVFVWISAFSSLDTYLGVELLGHMIILYLTFWRNNQSFPKWLFCSHQQCVKFPVLLHPWQHLLLSFFVLAILVRVKWYVIAVLVFIALVTNDSEYLCVHFLAKSVYLVWRNAYSCPWPIF